MWAKIEDASITELIPRPKAITIGFVAATYYTAEDEAADSEHVEGTLKTPRQGTNYPSNIFELWSASELEAIGIYKVTIDSTNVKDVKYYSNTTITYAYASGAVTGTYGTATAKDLPTLKTQDKNKVNKEAYGALQDSDWLVIRAAEGGTAVPSAWTTYRAAVRTKANSMETQIDGAANVDALAALYLRNQDDPPTRPLGEWPSKPE